MRLKHNHRNSNIRSSALQQLVVYLFLSIFSFSQLGANLHFDLEEAEHESVHCTIEDEEDSCHIKMVHGDLSAGCDHRQHLTDVSLKCELCDMLSARQILANYITSKTLQITRYSEKCDEHYVFDLVAEFHRSAPHRGPPQV